jgi:undecaprenyl-diphosphatase
VIGGFGEPRSPRHFAEQDRAVAQQRLISLERRRPALVTAGLAALLTAMLAVLLHGNRDTSVDHWITYWISFRLPSPWVRQALLTASKPALVAGVLGLLTVGALLRRAWNVAVFAVLGPTLAELVAELALKPLVHRERGGGSWAAAYTFPSGHETGVAALGTVLAVLTLRMWWHVVSEIAIVAALGLWVLAGAVGLIRADLHYPSDTIGGAGVVATAVAIDALTDRRRATSDNRARSMPKRVAEP